MFQALKVLFQISVEPEKRISYQEAIAALLLEVMMADDEINDREVEQVKRFLREETDLEDEIDSLYEEAKAGVSNANDLYQFTKVINESASVEQKVELVKGLWRVAFADGVVDAYEDHRIRRISELLFMPHSEFIQAKLSVQAEIEAE